MYKHHNSFFCLLICFCLCLLAACQSAAPLSANSATPSATQPPSAASMHCPQLPPSASSPAPTAPLSMYLKTAEDGFRVLNADTGYLRWKGESATIGGKIMSWAIGQNVVYLVTEQGAISEMNAADGGLRWCTPDDGELLAPGVPPNPSLVADQERVYATDGASGYVVALSASDGKHQWRQQVQGDDWLLAAADGNVVVSFGQSIAALDASTGKQNWQFQPAFSSLNPNVPAAIADGTVYFITYDFQSNAGTLYAVGINDGKERWHVQHQQGFGAPVVANGVVYVADFQGLYAFNASDGSLVWHVQHESTVAIAAVADGDVYLGDDSSLPGSVLAFSASDGKKQWQSPPDALQPDAQALLHMTPASTGIVFLEAGGGAVYVSFDDETVALDGSTGKTLWKMAGAALMLG